MDRHIFRALVLLSLISSFLVVASFDEDNARDEAARYCKMVNSGAWGAYRTDVNCGE